MKNKKFPGGGVIKGGYMCERQDLFITYKEYTESKHIFGFLVLIDFEKALVLLMQGFKLLWFLETI